MVRKHNKKDLSWGMSRHVRLLWTQLITADILLGLIKKFCIYFLSTYLTILSACTISKGKGKKKHLKLNSDSHIYPFITCRLALVLLSLLLWKYQNRCSNNFWCLYEEKLKLLLAMNDVLCAIISADKGSCWGSTEEDLAGGLKGWKLLII